MKEKTLNILKKIGIVIIILGILSWYPWLVKVDEQTKDTVCHNIWGFTFNCN